MKHNKISSLNHNNNIENWENLVKQVVSQQAWLASASCQELSSIQEATSAVRVAAYWYHFSVFAADFLCLALSLLQNHRNRSYVAQTVNEELGNGVPDQVHSVLLLEAYKKAGMDKNDILAYPTIELDQVLEPFRQRLLEAKNDYEIAGFFLGFELLAEHNISHVFECLQPDQCSREELRQTAYFQEHFQVEPEHIKRAITMGMNSCSDEHQIKSMLDTFHHSIAFWNRFWQVVHQDVLESNSFQLKPTVTSSREPVLATT
ncbi:MAG: iron-containing redox enzyme family protein [Coleofasciculus sp. A1-SPW-01]|uniref:iron-containing redox enzyme family protein n=1 Tax=Coleofasciculus sp. A1-SPW-01 TaxID=3070819 RepID=UPI0032FAE50E